MTTRYEPLPGTDEDSGPGRALKTLMLVSFLALAAAAVALAFALTGDRSATAAGSTPSGGSSGTANQPIADTTIDAPADMTMKPYNPVTKPVKPGDKVFELTTTERVVQVGDKKLRMWMFNGSVPGPILRAVEGDVVTIKIANDKSSKFLHSVDFHASRLTLGGGHVQVPPGKAGEYKFKLETPGVYMYHCATAPVLHHIGMGMYGMIIVQPKEGFGRPMPEFALTQSELYTDEGAIEAKTPVAMAFNGIPSQYIKNPIKVPADSEVRLFVMNAGPSEQSSFHVVGTIFDEALADGNPRNVTYGRQTYGLPSSGSGVFEMRLTDEGQYPFVTHQFNHAAMGAVGMLISGDGKPGPGGVGDPGENGHH